ncbi:28S ribosomal protein S7, mitochondrial [Dendroctonus ponderosae]|uniref:Small ribosomal subunit protein uS7 domain-containing protein n=1 Tax=Dendroctonus ponderosae TaxID=77166 RepID=J3JXP0_DENPD
MAAAKGLFAKCQLFKWNIQAISAGIFQNGMAIYPSFYIDPIFRKEVQQELVQSGEIDQYAHLPTKPAANNQTCSLTFDPDISLFTNYLMRDGRKNFARQLVEKSLEQVKRIQLEKFHKCTSEEDKAKIELDPKVIFHRAVTNSMPLLQLMPVKRGGVKYQVPVPVSHHRSRFLGMKWLIEASREKDKKTVRFWTQLARELVDASNNSGRVIRRKQDLHRQCEANKAYAHYRWS